ncbi:hypothetical protein LZ30DRAFT_200748 [Colletotrichum cereale]|nr:hypothetical protein LZ30DRAFT_200748 [Colletotrichum cereale]
MRGRDRYQQSRRQMTPRRQEQSSESGRGGRPRGEKGRRRGGKAKAKRPKSRDGELCRCLEKGRERERERERSSDGLQDPDRLVMVMATPIPLFGGLHFPVDETMLPSLPLTAIPVCFFGAHPMSTLAFSLLPGGGGGGERGRSRHTRGRVLSSRGRPPRKLEAGSSGGVGRSVG